MKTSLLLRVHRPNVHPILGPTIRRPTNLVPSAFQAKRPIPLEALGQHQLRLPPRPKQKHSPPKAASLQLVESVLQGSGFAWPHNLRVEDNWKGRGRWGEGRPDYREWLGVKTAHKELMLSLRAER